MADAKARNVALAAYLGILAVLCAGVIEGARLLGEQGMYLIQAYMLTPAVAGILTRLFFHRPGFADANLRLGQLRDYFTFWAAALAITAVSFLLFTLLGAIRWDFTGQAFLTQLGDQLAVRGRSMEASLPPGFTPELMLAIFFVGGLTVFNILPGLITGFGEEFGARGLMFPLMYDIAPWVAFLIGGLTWYAWHLPIGLVMPGGARDPLWLAVLNHALLAVGSICTAAYLAYVYVKTKNVWVTSIAHIALNNAARSFAMFAVVRNQLLANAGLTMTMMLVIAVLYWKGELRTFQRCLRATSRAAEL